MYSSTLSLTSMLDEDEWSTPRPGLFTPRKYLVPIEEEAGFDPRPGLDWYGKFRPYRCLSPGPSTP